MDVREAVVGCRRSGAALLAGLDGLTDDGARAPSLLPGWTVGHVLTHIARNGDSHRRMVEAALAGGYSDQYPGGTAQRESEIEAGSGRPAAELVADVATSDDLLADAFARVEPATWATCARRWGDQEWPLSDLPLLRWREVVLHSFDTGLAPFGPGAWDPGYVAAELDRQVAALAPRLPARALVEVAPTDASWSTIVTGPGGGDVPPPFVRLAAPAADLLAWLVGRAPGPEPWPVLAPWFGVP